MVECEICQILINENSDKQFIMLKEKEGARNFPIVIGIYEAVAIERYLNDKIAQRPLTHDLIIGTIKALGGEFRRLEIVRLENETFYGELVIAQGNREVRIDARPSDGMALTLFFKTPIFVSEDVLAQVS